MLGSLHLRPMPRAFGTLIAKFHMRRFREQLDVGALGREGRVYTSFSIILGAAVLVLWIAAWLVLIASANTVISILVGWVGLFKIKEIFSFALFDAGFIAGLYRAFITVIILLITAKALLQLLKLAFSVAVLAEGRLIIIESSLLLTRIHQIPYDRISRASVRENILYRFLRLGSLEILTGERDAPLRFGPAPRFPSLVSALMPLIVKK
jgi:hypothetical protein